MAEPTIDFLRDWKNESRFSVLLMMKDKGGVKVGSRTDGGRFSELWVAGYAYVVDDAWVPTADGIAAWEEHRERLALAGGDSIWTRVGLLPDVVERVVQAPSRKG